MPVSMIATDPTWTNPQTCSSKTCFEIFRENRLFSCLFLARFSVARSKALLSLRSARGAMAGEELGLGHRFRARRRGADPGISESLIHTCRSPACFIYSLHPHSSASANFQCWPVLSSSCSRERPDQVLTFFPSLKEPPVPVQCFKKVYKPSGPVPDPVLHIFRTPWFQVL